MPVWGHCRTLTRIYAVDPANADEWLAEEIFRAACDPGALGVFRWVAKMSVCLAFPLAFVINLSCFTLPCKTLEPLGFSGGWMGCHSALLFAFHLFFICPISAFFLLYLPTFCLPFVFHLPAFGIPFAPLFPFALSLREALHVLSMYVPSG